MLNYYEILEVEVDSNTAEIKAAYRKLARKYHPDINKEKNAVEKFKMITLAYETLSNSDKREKYNILNGIFKKPQTNPHSNAKKVEEEYKNTSTQTKEFAKEAKKETTKEKRQQPFSIFKVIKYYIAKFKKNKKAKDNKKPQKGQNITTDVTITPEEVITGSKRVINILTTQTCPKCYGHKFINGGRCLECNGSGEVSRRKKITVTIPKGIKDKAKLRLKGEGEEGKNGGANGDLFINVKIEAPTKINFDKQNIYYEVPITPFEAALGEEIKIPTFDGTIRLKLPKNTCSGQKFRIAGQGVKKRGVAGDLIVTVSIEFSQDLSDDEIKLYEKLKKLSKDDVRKNFANEN